MVKEFSQETIQHLLAGGYVECRDHHDSSCEVYALHKFKSVMLIAATIYTPVYFVPTILFKWKQLKENPKKTLKKAASNSLTSCIFAASYVTFYRYLYCLIKNSRQKMDSVPIIAGAIISTITILIEPLHRRKELTIYIFSKFLEALWNFLKKRNLVTPIPLGEVLIFAFSMGIIMFSYQIEPQAIHGTYYKILEQLFGKN